jgi:trimethylamine-N-oxide reductase (cytochrome c)
LKKEQGKLPEDEEKKQSGEVTRRDFLVGAGTVVIGGAIGAGLLSSCNDGEAKTVTATVEKTKTVTTTVGGDGAVTVTATETVGAGETITKTETSTMSTGGIEPAFEPEETLVTQCQCAVAFDIKNGRIVRGRPLHYQPVDGTPIEPLTITARGQSWTQPAKSPLSPYYLAHKKRVYSPNRILYPLKRVDWEPGGDSEKINPQNRGISKYKRISWDEAAAIIASEVERIGEKYGPPAITTNTGTDEGSTVTGGSGTPSAFLNYWGTLKYGKPCSVLHGTETSWSGGLEGGRYVNGYIYEPYTPGTIQDVCENTELMLVWPGDIERNFWHTGQTGGMMYHWLKELGVKHIFIGPDMNLAAGTLADKWIPIIPQTDCAAFMAIAYIWISEGTFDQDYLDTHTDGFDKWKAYIIGDEDGIAKTPQWASPLCGIPVYTLKAIARAWAKYVTTVTYGVGAGGVGRGPYAHEAQRMQLYLLAMQSWGKPGTHKFCQHGINFGTGKISPTVAQVSADSKINALILKEFGKTYSPSDRDVQFVPKDLFHDAILNPPVHYWVHNDPFYERTFPLEGENGSKIHMIWGGNVSWSGGATNGFKKLEAHRSPDIECVVYQTIWMEDACEWADIILPINSAVEKRDLISCYWRDTFHSLFLRHQCVKSIGESKSDFEAVCLVAEKMGLLDAITEGHGSYQAATEAWLEEGYESSGVADLISWDKLNEQGYYAQSLEKNKYRIPCAMKWFYDNPDSSPLATPSGKIEFESWQLRDNMPEDKERPPLAHWIRGGPASEGWCLDEDLSSERAESYPLGMVGGSHTWGYHSTHTDGPWTREIETHYIKGWDGWMYGPCWINPQTAADRGIEYGDIVRIYNERGAVLCAAYVTEKIMPGVLQVDQGLGGYDIIPGELCRGGNVNNIAPSIISTRALHKCHTSYLVELEKVTGDQMDEWRKQYPDAFAQDYDPQYGPLFERWVEEGGK